MGRLSTLSESPKLSSSSTTTGSDYGAAYMLGYERTVNSDDTLLVKYRYQPKEFTTPENRVRLEASYQRAF
jgi:hypothetical protein